MLLFQIGFSQIFLSSKYLPKTVLSLAAAATYSPVAKFDTFKLLCFVG